MKGNNFNKNIFTIIKSNYQFYISYFVFFVLSIFLLIQYSNAEITLWFNDNHTEIFNNIFIFFTNVGDGVLFGILILIMGFKKLKYLFDGLAFYLGSNIITHIIKFVVNEPRPLKYFGPEILNQIEGVDLHSSFSFPSGHTTSGFAIFLFLTFITNNKNISYIYLLSAIMVGISRVYLLQHFYIDIFVASIISVTVSTFLYYYIDNNNKLMNSNWYNYSLYNKYFNKNVSRETI